MSPADRHHLREPPHHKADPTDHQRPVIIGLYGISGSGKSHWLETFNQQLRNENFVCYDGSDVIAAATPGGLDAFQKLPEEEKITCAIVAGHFMFWTEGDDHGQTVCTSADLKVYTHILYLDVPPAEIAGSRQRDKKRNRPKTSIAHLETWQTTEKEELRGLCRCYGVLFTTVSESWISTGKLWSLILDFHEQTEELNMIRAKEKIDEVLASRPDTLETMLVIDADKTLSDCDSGARFWEQKTRSRSMENALAEVIGKDGFYPRQAVLAHGANPRLDATRLPLVELMDPDFLDSVIGRRRGLRVFHGTERPAAKLLMTTMRNASVSGLALKEAHRRVGWYLATEFCTQAIGIEPYPIVHVQGHEIEGHCLMHEKETLIVALMRGGDPMASGIHDAFPLAMYLHAQIPSDIQQDHLKDMATIILVDSVVNSGNSVLQFVKYIRNIHATVHIVIVAGVIHSGTVSTSSVTRSLGQIRDLSLIALRLSDNKFAGRGTTDTGNRLFNTVHMD